MFNLTRELRELVQMVHQYENMHGDEKTNQAIKIAEYLRVLRKKHFAHIV